MRHWLVLFLIVISLVSIIGIAILNLSMIFGIVVAMLGGNVAAALVVLAALVVIIIYLNGARKR